MAKGKDKNPPRGPENGYPDSKAASIGGKKTSTKTKGFK